MGTFRRFQYQNIAGPVLETSQFPERVDEPKWHQPYSEPIRNQAAKRAVVFVAALAGYFGCIAPTQEQAFANGAHADWIQPLSEPIIKSRKLPTNEQHTLAFVDWTKSNDHRWLSPLSEPVRRIPFRLEQFTWAPTEIVLPEKWFAELREPSVKKKFLSPSNQQSVAFVDWQPIADSASQRWLQDFSVPTQRPFGVSGEFYYSPYVIPTEEVTLDKWYESLSEPRQRSIWLEPRYHPYQAYTRSDPFPESVTADRWQIDLNLPTRRKPNVFTDFILTPVTTETITLDKWYVSLSDPTRVWRQNQQALAYIGADPFPETVSSDRWLQGISLPVRAKPRLEGLFAYSPLIAETITPDKWFNPLTDPVRRITTRLGDFTYNTSEITIVAKWYEELSQPVHLRLLPPTEQQAIFFEVEPPVFEQFGWFVSLSEWPRQRPKVTFQQYLAYAEAAPFTETVSLDRWLIGLSEPRRPLYSGLGNWYQQTYTGPAFTPVPEITVSGTIEEPGPVFVKVLLYQGLAYQPFPFPSAPSVFPDSWRVALSEPRRILRAQQYQYTAFSPTEIVLEPEWFEPLIERPIVRRLPVSDYQYLAFTKASPFPETVSSDRWQIGLSLPTRRKPFSYQTNVSWPTFFTGAATDLRVYTGWDYPLRREWRGRFPTREQQALAFVKHAPFGENVTVGSWGQPFGVPVRRVRFTPKQELVAPSRWTFPVGPTTIVELLTTVVFTVVLPHRTDDGGAYGEFSYGEHTLDRPASFTIKVIKRFHDRIKVKIESIGDLLHIHKKKFKRMASNLPVSGAGKFSMKGGSGSTKVSGGKGDIEPKSGDALTTPKAGRGNIRIKPDP